MSVCPQNHEECCRCGGAMMPGTGHLCPEDEVELKAAVDLAERIRAAEEAVIEAAIDHTCQVAPWFRLQRCKICMAVDALRKAKEDR